jgi:hypothetical protein
MSIKPKTVACPRLPSPSCHHGLSQAAHEGQRKLRDTYRLPRPTNLQPQVRQIDPLFLPERHRRAVARHPLAVAHQQTLGQYLRLGEETARAVGGDQQRVFEVERMPALPMISITVC